MNEHDLKIIQAIGAEHLLRLAIFDLRQQLAEISKPDRAPEPAKSYLQERLEKAESALSQAIKSLNIAEIGKMLSCEVRVISTSPKKRTMQVVIKDKDSRHSETRHLKYENGGWHGFSLLRRGVVNYSAAGLLERPAELEKAA